MKRFIYILLAALAAAASSAQTNDMDKATDRALILQDMRVALTRYEVSEREDGSTTTSRVAVIMFMHRKNHIHLEQGNSLEPAPGHEFTLFEVHDDGSVVLRDEDGTLISINPLAEDEKQVWLDRHGQ